MRAGIWIELREKAPDPDSRRFVMFTSPRHKPSTKPVELFATLALALSTLVAVTVVSIGIARAEGLTTRSLIAPHTLHVRIQ